jgi:hypothetical protein
LFHLLIYQLHSFKGSSKNWKKIQLLCHNNDFYLEKINERKIKTDVLIEI